MNMHGTFCGCGVRFHACAQSLPFGQKVGRNHAYFLNVIWDMAEYTNQLVRLCNKGLSLGCKAITGSLQYEAVELMYCLAFLLVLSVIAPLQRSPRPLRTRKRELERKLEGLRWARIRQAATPKIPEDLRPLGVEENVTYCDPSSSAPCPLNPIVHQEGVQQVGGGLYSRVRILCGQFVICPGVNILVRLYTSSCFDSVVLF
nr:telomerase reverse transcriptase [Salvelinus alpinus]XP_023856047.1 telomerase reverse transcriptase [Salvelinus alpinus]